MIRCAKLLIPVDIESLKEEVRRLTAGPQGLLRSSRPDARWLPHFNNAYYSGSWEVLPLRAPGGKSDGIVPDLIADATYADTDLMEAFPSVQKLLHQLECPVMSVRFLNLKPGGFIKPHRDAELSFEKGEARLHLPVFTNDGVEFLIDNGNVYMKEGECWYINANRVHSVANRGNSDRVHLVVDCMVNDWLRSVFDSSEKTLVQNEENEDELKKVISELRLQNTETSNRIADSLMEKLKQ